MVKQENIESLKKRSDFLHLRTGKFVRRAGFFLQVAPNNLEKIRVGYTCSKKIGNAVARNRAKRRLREMAKIALSEFGEKGFDYVFIGKREVTALRKFDKLLNDAQSALEEVHK